jgi:hypothetical protein
MSELQGGCLCGAVRFEIRTEQPLVAGHCYCLDCRKSSGTAHCTHVVAPAADFVVTGTTTSYERAADSGNVVARHFCPTCGSPVYSTNDGMPGLVFLRASCLDDPDAVTPQMSVYASRAPGWDAVDPDLPAFPLMANEKAKEIAASASG